MRSYETVQVALEFTLGQTSLELEILLSHPPGELVLDLNYNPS